MDNNEFLIVISPSFVSVPAEETGGLLLVSTAGIGRVQLAGE
jgi:hypothetical protein